MAISRPKDALQHLKYSKLLRNGILVCQYVVRSTDPSFEFL